MILTPLVKVKCEMKIHRNKPNDPLFVMLAVVVTANTLHKKRDEWLLATHPFLLGRKEIDYFNALAFAFDHMLLNPTATLARPFIPV
jgi:hypothetical protein